MPAWACHPPPNLQVGQMFQFSTSDTAGNLGYKPEPRACPWEEE